MEEYLREGTLVLITIYIIIELYISMINISNYTDYSYFDFIMKNLSEPLSCVFVYSLIETVTEESGYM